MESSKFPPITRIDNISFRIYTEEEISKISAIQVTKDESFNSLGHYFDKGVYDLHMGPMTSNEQDQCKTCNSNYFNCTGHFGHINLPSSVLNPVFIEVFREILERICPVCFRFQVNEKRGVEFIYENQFFNAGFSQVEVASLIRKALMDPSEAHENLTAVGEGEEEDENNTIANLNELGLIMSELEKEFKRMKNTEEPDKEPTCNSQSAYTQISKKFLRDSKPAKNRCIYCEERLLKLSYQDSKIMIRNNRKREALEKGDGKLSIPKFVSETQPFLTTEQAMEILRNCYEKDGLILKSLYPILTSTNLLHPTDIFFINKLLVTPPRYRPCNKLNGQLVENETSVLYKYILKWSKCLKFLKSHTDESTMPEKLKELLKRLQGDTLMEKLYNIICLLQSSVNNIFDSEINKFNKIAQKGIRQIIEKKFGLFRRNLMGKRVNFSARSVAAPDPMLGVDEVGVPLEFALKLSYPASVTPWNVAKLRKLVQNGPMNFPGAVMVEDEEGRKITLKANDPKQRDAIAKSLLTRAESCVKKVNVTKIVYRHLDNGDYVLMNRQPTLHKPSIQAHKVRVMPKDRVLRMPYANCKAYNADFDGDELNMHFPQNEMARGEMEQIITTCDQYLTPKDGSPLAGLIQDCIVSGVKITMRGNFFNKEDYMQLVFNGLLNVPRRIRLLRPAILKPQQLWSGKQVISTILLNLIPDSKAKPTFNFKTTVKVEMWQTHESREPRCNSVPERRKESMTESEFVMREGELVCGVLDKCAIGSTSYGLVHVCYDLYGGSLASNVLTSINRLCVFYLQWVGHTISLKEFVTPKKAANDRRKSLKDLIETTKYTLSKKLDVEEKNLEAHFEAVHKSENEKEMAVIDAAYTSTLGPTTSTIISDNEKSLYRNNLQNNMRMMIDTGAKGSRVNMNQMASVFGSVAIDGKRMPMSVTGKTLPSFKPYECDPRAGGYIPTRFVTGMDPRSFFFLCIVGRDSLQHTAVKTANSGYMQRCLIKHLEGIKVAYDMTVRNSDGVVLQFEYGEDGLDVTKVPFLRDVDTIDAIIDPLLESYNYSSSDKRSMYSPEIEKKKKKIKKCLRYTGAGNRIGGFLNFTADQREVAPSSSSSINLTHGRSERTLQLLKEWYHLPPIIKEKYKKEEKKKKECVPISSTHSKSSLFGVISEALDSLVEKYYDEKYSARRSDDLKLTKEQRKSDEEKKKTVKSVLYAKAMKSQVDPGHAVGALCAQAIGEPLTQMTLNTFHFAGRDELNVTLGVPRMIEILRTASESIKTPIMEVPFKHGISKSMAEKLKVKLTPVPLEKVISHVDVTSSLEIQPKLCRRTILRFWIHPYSIYKRVYCVKPTEVLHFMEKFYFKKILIKSIKSALSKINMYSSASKKKLETEIENNQESTLGQQREGLEEDSDSEEEDDPAQAQAIDDGISGMGKHGKLKEEDYSDDDDNGEEMDEEDGDDDEEKRVTDDAKGEANVKKEPVSEDMEQEMEVDNPEESLNNDISNELDVGVPITPLLTYATEKALKKLKAHPKWSSVQLQSCDIKNILKDSLGKEKALPDKSENSKTISIDSTLKVNEYLMRKNRVIREDFWITDYNFDEDNNLWSEVTLLLPIAEGRYDLASILKETSASTMIHSVKNIKKAYVVQKDDQLLLRTEGVNIRGLSAYEDILEINRVYTNNIHLMAKTYGIEAAQRTIIKEIVEVQKAYDIKVNFRHLTLLADYFTCEGVYKACSRMALDTCASPIQKMSYETTFAFLKNSLLKDKPDYMKSPSACVMVGQPVKMGTNFMEILTKPH